MRKIAKCQEIIEKLITVVKEIPSFNLCLDDKLFAFPYFCSKESTTSTNHLENQNFDL